jgi:DNA polymerase-4
VGISYNRLLAKLASDIKKPDGVFEITIENRDEVLFKTRLSDVCGLGFRLERRLFNAGITGFKALREIPMECLKATFGPFWSVELKRLSWGEDDSLLTRIGEIPKAKSVSRTYTLHADTTDQKIVKATLRNLSEEAVFKAREMGMTGRLVGLSVRGENQGDYRHKTLKYFIDSGRDTFEIAWRLYQEMKWPGRVRFLGIWLSLLAPKKDLNLSLFPEEKRKENLTAAMDKVNKRFGELTVYPGALLFGERIKSEVNGFLGDKAFRFGRV